MLRNAIEGIKARGQSDVGDKTLLDALVPLTDRLEQEIKNGSDAATTLAAVSATTREAAEATSALIAKRGRASYTGRAQHRFGRRRRDGRRRDRRADQPGLDKGVLNMKKFVNDPKSFVPEMLEGIALANPNTIVYEPEWNLIMRADAPRADKVSIVQGSGSGHEPAHVMVVGKGMLDAACPGDVFAAPPMDYVYETAKRLASPKGVLLLVNNYTGDRMAFEMGKEMAESEGINVEILMINDDVAVKDSTYTIGRRGVAGNFFVIKAVGAASERGDSLEEVIRIGKKVNDVTRTMGVALTACTPPAKGEPLFQMGEDEMEVGVGIHGEPGRERIKIMTADEIVDLLLDAVVPDLPYQSGDRVALMINGLGGTPISELYILFRRAHQQLRAKGISVARSYVNEYCTSLDMAGASLTLVRLDDEIEELLEAPAEIPNRVC